LEFTFIETKDKKNINIIKMEKKPQKQNKTKIQNTSQKKNQTTEHLIIRLFDIISIPFFILLAILIIEDQLYTMDFYFEYAIYFGLLSGVITLLMYGFAGYRAKKNESKNIKPSYAGLSLGLLIGVIGFILTMFVSSSFDDVLNNIDSEDYNNLKDNSNQEDEFVIGSESEFESESENFGNEDFENSFKLFGYIFGIIGIIFGGLIGMLFGFIGGKVAQ